MVDTEATATDSPVPTYAVTLAWDDGRTADLDVGADETILDAAEDAGIGLPFGCRYGACATCTAQVCTGSVRHRRSPTALKARHRNADYALLCIATPTADTRLRVGADVQADLVPNPWK